MAALTQAAMRALRAACRRRTASTSGMNQGPVAGAGHRGPPAPARGAALGRRRELPADRRPDQGLAPAAGRDPGAARGRLGRSDRRATRAARPRLRDELGEQVEDLPPHQVEGVGVAGQVVQEAALEQPVEERVGRLGRHDGRRARAARRSGSRSARSSAAGCRRSPARRPGTTPRTSTASAGRTRAGAARRPRGRSRPAPPRSRCTGPRPSRTRR